jgi:hypothetical protein
MVTAEQQEMIKILIPIEDVIETEDLKITKEFQ